MRKKNGHEPYYYFYKKVYMNESKETDECVQSETNQD